MNLSSNPTPEADWLEMLNGCVVEWKFGGPAKAVSAINAKIAADYVPKGEHGRAREMDIIDQVVRSTMMSSFVYQKISFDNAKDTRAMLDAANANCELLVSALKAKMHRYVDEIVAERQATQKAKEV